MGPLFIRKHEEDSPSPPHPHQPTDRSTPEGQEPDRNEHDQQHEPPPPQLDTNHEKKREKKKSHATATHHHHHRYSLSTSDSVTYDLPNQPQPQHHHRVQNSALRKYVILVQDCFAIRFASNGHKRTAPFLTPHQKYPPDHHSVIGDLRFPRSYAQNGPEPLDGHALFKAFITSNKKCYWNPPLSEAVNSLEYKGYVYPATVLVSTTNRHMNVLRNAWSRRTLRDPPGFRAEFLGEIEELFAQPVQQGQFAPLSDSLCWAIAELTESGQEAFIDSIQRKLHTSYPSISHPPKELIFQTLEKLIREQKIYQTSHGYYVVTPDISTYINYSRSVTPNVYGRIYSDCFEKLSASRYSTPYASTPSVSHDPVSEELRRILSSPPQNVHLKRHNSLKIIRNKQENYHIHNHPSMGARSLSFRLSKCNSLFESDKESDEDEQHESQPPPPPPDKHDPPQQDTHPKPEHRIKKRPSFFSRLFTFRCTSRQKPPSNITTTTTPQPPKKWSSVPNTLSPTTTDSPKRHRPQHQTPRRRATNPRPISPSSSVSGIYASITQRENVTHQKLNVSSTKASASLYDLFSTRHHHHHDHLSPSSSWQEPKNDSSDVSH